MIVRARTLLTIIQRSQANLIQDRHRLAIAGAAVANLIADSDNTFVAADSDLYLLSHGEIRARWPAEEADVLSRTYSVTVGCGDSVNAPLEFADVVGLECVIINRLLGTRAKHHDQCECKGGVELLHGCRALV